ncbi:hypothetical protein AMAG_06004 [Allomyces macrogynus ATCC 38327]|uniref:DUF2470 domain-containing protein n=1 Tax=Allomyces macrogynus (strain ATCC 38327) TaxID=578462 RepID=A0A0L0SDJ5_ALLM3|nr:hypothetical protein AMAG_06004 [Allomyces macrogynus ATCC 38327]|eukprot:KNE60628.1 hypothetical protein AMAG_06004 [Allomyces macrogynus ATCC 38327]
MSRPPKHAPPLAYLVTAGVFPVLTYVAHASTVPASLAWIPRRAAQKIWWGLVLVHLAEASVATFITVRRRYRAADVAKWFVGTLTMGVFVLRQLFVEPRKRKSVTGPGKEGEKKAQ